MGGGGTITVMNCLFSGNHADADGGAIWFKDCTGHIVNCTLNENDADGDGGGLFHDTASSTTSTVQNCIFWDDTAAAGHEIYNNGGTVNVTHTDIDTTAGSAIAGSGTTNQTSIIHGDPLFTTGLRLSCGSPCINVGLDDSEVLADTFDVNGDTDLSEKTPDLDRLTRIVVSIDMGAYERQQTPCGADVNSDGVVNIDDLLHVINHWGTCGAPCPSDCGPGPCGGDGVVNIDDLLLVINQWGPCDHSYIATFPTSVNDCFTECSESYEAFSPEWFSCVNDCIDALCKAHIIDCD